MESTFVSLQDVQNLIDERRIKEADALCRRLIQFPAHQKDAFFWYQYARVLLLQDKVAEAWLGPIEHGRLCPNWSKDFEADWCHELSRFYLSVDKIERAMCLAYAMLGYLHRNDYDRHVAAIKLIDLIAIYTADRQWVVAMRYRCLKAMRRFTSLKEMYWYHTCAEYLFHLIRNEPTGQPYRRRAWLALLIG